MRKTKQKQLILSHLQLRHDHPTAQQVYESLAQEGHDVSVATCYRNLKAFCLKKDCIQINTLDQIAHYDFNDHQHCHLVCTACHQIMDIELEELFSKEWLLEKKHFMLDPQTIVLQGICANCQQEKEKENGTQRNKN